jgi:hypothetical protein
MRPEITPSELGESYILEEDPLAIYSNDPDMMRYYDPDRPDYYRSLEKMRETPGQPLNDETNQ